MRRRRAPRLFDRVLSSQQVFRVFFCVICWSVDETPGESVGRTAVADVRGGGGWVGGWAVGTWPQRHLGTMRPPPPPPHGAATDDRPPSTYFFELRVRQTRRSSGSCRAPGWRRRHSIATPGRLPRNCDGCDWRDQEPMRLAGAASLARGYVVDLFDYHIDVRACVTT